MGSAKKKPAPPESGATSRRAQRYLQRRAQVRNRVIGAIGAALAVIAVIAVVVLTRGGDDKPVPPPFVGSTLNLVLGEYFIHGDLTAPAGEVRLHAVNQGGIIHNVGVRGGHISNDIQPGRDTTVDIGKLVPGEYELYCDVPDHAQHGMVAKLIITAAAPTSAAPTTT